MLANQNLTGIELLDKLAAHLENEEQATFAAAIERGYLVTEPEQRDLQRLWTLWCMKKECPDVRVERHEDVVTVTMHLGPCHTTLSADGTVAIRRAFERYGMQAPAYQTSNWCKHPRVPSHSCAALARELVEIAFLDGVPMAA